MGILLKADKPPLREEPDGSLRIGESRVLLELVICAFQQGATPESIVESFPTLALPDVYSVIAYHLRHPNAFTTYLDRVEQEGDEIQRRLDAAQPELEQIRARIRAQRQAR